MSIVDFKEIPDGETWELFTRDFLEILGFYIDTHPNRGSDGGADIIVSENIKGKLHNYQFRWLVSGVSTTHSIVTENY